MPTDPNEKFPFERSPHPGPKGVTREMTFPATSLLSPSELARNREFMTKQVLLIQQLYIKVIEQACSNLKALGCLEADLAVEAFTPFIEKETGKAVFRSRVYCTKTEFSQPVVVMLKVG